MIVLLIKTAESIVSKFRSYNAPLSIFLQYIIVSKYSFTDTTIKCTYELPNFCNYFSFCLSPIFSLYRDDYKLLIFGSCFGQIQLCFKNSFIEHMVLSFSTIYTRLRHMPMFICTNCYKCKVFANIFL
jgi:hypothetical protein